MDALDKFGEFLIANLRDKALRQNQMLLSGALKAKVLQSMQQRLGNLPAEQKDLLREVVVDLVDTATHDLLLAIQDAHDRELGIEVFVDGKNVATVSGMLQGEHLGEGGWIERFSEFPEC